MPIIMAVRQSGAQPHPEAEPVEVEPEGQSVVLTLDDGETLTFDRREFAALIIHEGPR